MISCTMERIEYLMIIYLYFKKLDPMSEEILGIFTRNLRQEMTLWIKMVALGTDCMD